MKKHQEKHKDMEKEEKIETQQDNHKDSQNHTDNKQDNQQNHQQDEQTNQKDSIPKHEFDNLKDMLQRTHAEFQNYRKRSDDEKSNFIKLSNSQLIKKILPVLDNFELALKHNKENNEFSKGMSLIYDQLLDILLEEGLQKINTVGKFNPNLHEALMVEESDEVPGTILQELQKGYLLGDKLLRSSKVKISKQKNSKNNAEVDKNE